MNSSIAAILLVFIAAVTWDAASNIARKLTLRFVGNNIPHWAYAQLLGINGAPFPPSRVRVTSNPISLHWCLYEHVKLDNIATAKVLHEREESVKTTVAAFNEALGKGEWTSEAVLQTLKQLNTPTLVHTYYYQSDQCIELIANWLSRTKEEAEEKWRKYCTEEVTQDITATLFLSPDERWERHNAEEQQRKEEF
jgi:hypothetical protein